MEKRRRTGRYRRVSSDAAWQRVAELVADGFSPWWISTAAGLYSHTIQQALQDERTTGHRRRFGAVIAAALVSADMDTATEGTRDARGTRRRLQALAVHGWGLDTLVGMTGVPLATLQRLRAGASEAVHPPAWRAVRDVYEQIGDKRGTGVQAARQALARGWLPTFAWDDPDTDPDPQELDRDVEVDEVAVQRVLAGDGTVARGMSVAERQATVAAWTATGRSLSELERVTGWQAGRYVRRDAA